VRTYVPTAVLGRWPESKHQSNFDSRKVNISQILQWARKVFVAQLSCRGLWGGGEGYTSDEAVYDCSWEK
jgi:hypothetical protein